MCCLHPRHLAGYAMIISFPSVSSGGKFISIAAAWKVLRRTGCGVVLGKQMGGAAEVADAAVLGMVWWVQGGLGALILAATGYIWVLRRKLKSCRQAARQKEREV